jgi:hypothetical protein
LELGAGAEEVFAEFSAEATAAASLAQVCVLAVAHGRVLGAGEGAIPPLDVWVNSSNVQVRLLYSDGLGHPL